MTIHTIDSIVFNLPDEYTLANNIPLFGFNGSQLDILRIDLVFNAGRSAEPEKLISESTAKLFKSGTATQTNFVLNDAIEFLGTTIKASSGYNSFTVSLYCMHRFLEPSLQLLLTCLSDIIFPENEIDELKKNAISKLKVNREKNDYLADVEFKKTLFGDNHPYGYETTEDAILAINKNAILQMYQQYITPENATIFIAGKYDAAVIKLIDNYIGNWSKPSIKTIVSNTLQFSTNIKSLKKHIKKENAVQSSLVIGKILFNRHHKDYAGFVLLNTILGGYFGSRLMSNIREEKGLTYGIYSVLLSIKEIGMFCVQTDTNLENTELCLKEIYFEMERLQNELIPEKEITQARNYLLGKLLHRTDGPFNQIELYKNYYLDGLPIHKFDDFVSSIQRADALSLQQLAQQYLTKDSMLEVVVG